MNFCTLEQGSKSLGTNKFTLRLAIEWGDNQQKELCYPDNIKQYPGVGIGTLTSNASITQKQCTRHNGSFITHTLASPFLQQTATFLASSHTMQRGHAPCTALWVSERGSTCSWCWRTVFAACGTLLPMQIRLHAHSSASGSMLWAGSSLSSHQQSGLSSGILQDLKKIFSQAFGMDCAYHNYIQSRHLMSCLVR